MFARVNLLVSVGVDKLTFLPQTRSPIECLTVRVRLRGLRQQYAEKQYELVVVSLRLGPFAATELPTAPRRRSDVPITYSCST